MPRIVKLALLPENLPLHKLTEFVKPNTIDSYQDTPSWTNKENDDVLNQLLNQIKSYINSFSTYVDKNTKTFLLHGIRKNGTGLICKKTLTISKKLVIYKYSGVVVIQKH